jgi:hypothetical protein
MTLIYAKKYNFILLDFSFTKWVLHLPSLSFSKRRQGLAGLAPTKALKTKTASAAGAAARHAGWLASAQGALRRGAQAARVAMGQASPADPPARAAIMPGEAADAVAASSPADLLPAPASTSAGAVADSPVEPPVAADVGMVEAPPPVVISDLPVLGHEERATVVAEVSDRRPATLAKWRPSTSTVAAPDASAAGGPDALVEGRAEPWPVLGSSGLIPAQLNPNEWCGQPLLFWSRATSYSEPLLSLNDELEERSRDNFREYIYRGGDEVASVNHGDPFQGRSQGLPGKDLDVHLA